MATDNDPRPRSRLLVDAQDLERRLGDGNWAVVDCRFSLADTGWGEAEYRRGHIPGAVYAHLDRDLSGPVRPGFTGRHPLPEAEVMAATLGSWGVGDGVGVVAYDDMGGAIAARLWWLLRWLGHDGAALLDGGWPAWVAAGGAMTSGSEVRPPRIFSPRPRPELLVHAAQVTAACASPDQAVFDSRSAERYRGENETTDPVPGHIPGAESAPYQDNLAPDGRLLPVAEVRRRFEALLGERKPEEAVFYCGSGVTAALNVFALALAGLGDSRLYAGSWSEWITDPARPVAV
ncbi:MAG: sulfurtransferase [Anaerolineae bacterium]